MQSDKPDGKIRPPLRLLSEEELQSGLSPLDLALLEFRAKVLQLDHEVSHTKGVGQEIEAFAKQVASERLAAGKEAYMRVEGVEGIVRQNPDGTRDAVEVIDGKPVIVRPLQIT